MPAPRTPNTEQARKIRAANVRRRRIQAAADVLSEHGRDGQEVAAALLRRTGWTVTAPAPLEDTR
jgi:hypothetical protein